MSGKIDKKTQACLECGEVAGKPHTVQEQYPEGLSATTRDGQRVFFSQTYLDAIKRLHRGRG